MAGMQLREGDLITLDANTGAIYLHEIPIIVARIADERFQNVQQDIIGVIDSLIAASLNGE
jgi:hypothetical protein